MSVFKKGDRVFTLEKEIGWAQVVYSENRLMVADESSSYYVDENLVSFTEYTLQGFSQKRPKKEYPIGTDGFFWDGECLSEKMYGILGRVDKYGKYYRVGGLFSWDNFISLEDYIKQKQDEK